MLKGDQTLFDSIVYKPGVVLNVELALDSVTISIDCFGREIEPLGDRFRLASPGKEFEHFQLPSAQDRGLGFWNLLLAKPQIVGH